MKTNEKKNTSAKKKLIPAVAMLTTSAVMLSTATYAWFTMSREVEVTGIKLTATTPQTIEISLGQATTSNTLTHGVEATAPNSDDMWTHTAATGSVYQDFGKLIPVSSVDGFNMFYTEKATENGKKVSDVPNPFTKAETAVGWEFKEGGKSAETGAVVNAAENDGSGYYLDIPVWFRTTSTDAVTLGLEVEIKNSSDDDTKSVLYKAARVAILPKTKSAQKVFSETGAKYYKDGKAVATAGATLAASYGDVSAATEATVTGGKVTNPDATTQVATVTASTGTGYGGAVKYYIRVWLEGEDEACWNANAGQDFVINLKFHDLSNK
ncbi:MAG: hypothetical protein UC707_05185 [Ruminococcus sp.]|uniref:hypothetical protein n=1 Tax=Ruminococcus sp. TaxID=41978 RepID=UPI002E78E6FA|nr:hypothetical protein [Ruminococcus sp.]MEE0560838.1 hypothetical protein [Ruminococcus sp.]